MNPRSPTIQTLSPWLATPFNAPLKTGSWRLARKTSGVAHQVLLRSENCGDHKGHCETLSCSYTATDDSRSAANDSTSQTPRGTSCRIGSRTAIRDPLSKTCATRAEKDFFVRVDDDFWI